MTHDTHYYNRRWYLIQRHSAHSGSLFSISLVYYFSDWNVLMILIWWTFSISFGPSFLTWEVHTKHKAVKCLNIVPKFSNGLCLCVYVWPGWKVRHEFWRLYRAKLFFFFFFLLLSLLALLFSITCVVMGMYSGETKVVWFKNTISFTTNRKNFVSDTSVPSFNLLCSAFSLFLLPAVY